MQNAAKGAALGTGTSHELVVTGVVYNLRIIVRLNKVQYKALQGVGGYTLTAEERAGAEALTQSLPASTIPFDAVGQVQPLAANGTSGWRRCDRRG